MRPPTALVIALLAAAPGPAFAGAEAAWRALPAAAAPDSCANLLRIWEAAPPRGVTASEAAMALGQFHYARGEYRQARDAFTRASARVAGAEQGEARYWVGLSALAVGEGAAAREAFAAAAATLPARRSLAQLGSAQAWDADRRPEKSLDALHALLAADPGEAGPAALERLGALAEQFHRNDEAKQARKRLAREYPRSLEAARLNAVPVAPAGAGPVAIQIGVFADRERAAALARQARVAGFSSAQLVERKGDGSRPTLWVVRLGSYATREDANADGEKAQRALGVGWQVMAP
jgi:tetratricopeptide (TPR) repeat protein